jgi:molybdopterin molybdotransferase
MSKSDIVIISGGSSQGDKDFTARIIDRTAMPGIFTHGLAVKPGKPTILGWDEESKTLLAGLPGHPVSAMMVFEILFAKKEKWKTENHSSNFQFSALSFPLVCARVSGNVPGAPGKLTLLPVILSPEKNENAVCPYFAEPIFGKAGMVSTLTRADGYIIIDMNKEGLKKDETVLVHLF